MPAVNSSKKIWPIGSSGKRFTRTETYGKYMVSKLRHGNFCPFLVDFYTDFWYKKRISGKNKKPEKSSGEKMTFTVSHGKKMSFTVSHGKKMTFTVSHGNNNVRSDTEKEGFILAHFC